MPDVRPLGNPLPSTATPGDTNAASVGPVAGATSTLAGALELSCRRWPDNVALSGAGDSLTYDQLWKAATNLGEAYRDLGIKQGDRVIGAAPNSRELVVAMAAAWLSGVVHVGVSRDLTAPELESLFRRTEASAILQSDWNRGRARGSAALGETPVDVARSGVVLSTLGPGGKVHGEVLVGRLLSQAGGSADVASKGYRPQPQDPATIFFTSGTTGSGQAKGPIGHHGPLCETWQWLAEALGCGPDDVHLGQLPLAVGFGVMMAAVALFTGGCLRLMDRFSPATALRVIDEENVTVLNGIPTHFRLLLREMQGRPIGATSVRRGVGTGAAFAPGLIDQIESRLGLRLMLLYGSPELQYVCTNDRQDVRRGAMGRPKNDDVIILGDDGVRLRAGEEGEIAFRVKTPVRYWREEKTLKPGELYLTGDLGLIKEDGCLYLADRYKHQVNRSGFRVDIAEVEGRLYGCPGVADAGVIGRPDSILGERVCACIVPSSQTATPNLEQVRGYLASHLARYKLPEELCVVPHIPRTGGGSIDRESLRALCDSLSRQSVPKR